MDYEYLEEVFITQKEFLGEEKEINGVMPIVSVHVITYQQVKYIKECLDGILMQETNFPIEIVVGEDESTDGTREICMEYAIKNPNKIRLFLRDRKKTVKNEGNVNMYLNGKLTLKSCRGKYIALCEGDDFWTDPYKLQKQVDFLEANDNAVACFTNATVQNEITGKDYIYVKKLNEGIVPNDTIIQIGGSIYPTASLVFKRKILNFQEYEYIKGFNGDELLIFLLSDKGEVHFINQVTCVYRRWGGGVFSSIANNSARLVELKKQNLNGLFDYNKITNYKYNKSVKRKISLNSLYIIRKDKSLKKLKYLFHLHYRDIIKLIFGK